VAFGHSFISNHHYFHSGVEILTKIKTVNGVEIFFLGDKTCSLCETHFELPTGPKFLDIEDQVKHFSAVHPFLLVPKPIASGVGGSK